MSGMCRNQAGCCGVGIQETTSVWRPGELSGILRRLEMQGRSGTPTADGTENNGAGGGAGTQSAKPLSIQYQDQG